MAYRVELLPHAERQFGKLARPVQESVAAAFETLQFDPFAGDIKKLHKPLEGFRVRKGEHRILFIVVRNTVIIYSIAHRKDAYR